MNVSSSNQNYENEINRLKKAVEERDTSAIDVICQELNSDRQGLLDVFGDEFTIYLSAAAADWFWQLILSPEEYQEWNKLDFAFALKLLENEGCQEGKDFSVIHSCGENRIILSEKANQCFLKYIPSEHHQQICKRVSQQHLLPNKAVQKLELKLGVPFFDNLLIQAQNRLPKLTDGQAVTYIATIAIGVSERHPQIEDFPFWFLSNATSELSEVRSQSLWQMIDSGQFEECNCWVEDLIIAAGGAKHIEYADISKKVISPSGLKLLFEIYRGEQQLLDLGVAEFN